MSITESHLFSRYFYIITLDTYNNSNIFSILSLIHTKFLHFFYGTQVINRGNTFVTNFKLRCRPWEIWSLVPYAYDCTSSSHPVICNIAVLLCEQRIRGGGTYQGGFCTEFYRQRNNFARFYTAEIDQNQTGKRFKNHKHLLP